MDISVHIRGQGNLTDERSLALGAGLEALGHKVSYRSRGEDSNGADLVVQTGFGRSAAVLSAIECEIPFLIMEAPYWRDFYDVHTVSSFGYNGLNGSATRAPVPDTPRPVPQLQPLITEGRQLIVGQKPTDHSLGGTDHVKWLLEKRLVLPEADFRPHPLMIPQGTLEPIREVLPRYKEVYTFSSTVGAEAVVAGCTVYADSDYSMVRECVDRARWLHELSWAQFHHQELREREVCAHILSGYERALADAEAGRYTIPRERVDGQAICQRYYREIDRIR